MISAKSQVSLEAENHENLDQILDRVRSDFPILSEMVNGSPLVYLDNAATSQKPIFVLDRIRKYYECENSNVHRGVHALSQRATDAYESARETTRAFINAERTSEIVLTSGTTEAINLVASSFVRPRAGERSEILVTTMEHHSNIVPWQLLAEQTGVRVVAAPICPDGSLDLEMLERLITPNTVLLALAHVSNSLGSINPIVQIIASAHERDVPVLVDGAQAVPHMNIDVRELDCDFYTFSGHKMFGPTGIGVLYGKEKYLEEMPPYQGGGDMIESVSFSGTRFNKLPHKFEAGTPNIAGTVGLASAIEYIRGIGYDFIQRNESRLLTKTLGKLGSIESIRFVGEAKDRASVVSFLLGKNHPYDVGTILDRMGVAVRTGHHCTEPLMSYLKIPGTVRASFAFYNSPEEVDRLYEAVLQAENLLM